MTRAPIKPANRVREEQQGSLGHSDSRIQRFRRSLFKLLFLTLPSLVVVLVVIEIALRLLISVREIPNHVYDQADQMLLYDVNGPREGLFTIGKFAQQRGRWRINNVGWNSDIDYAEKRSPEKPLIAVIGDSFVEAFQVDVEKSLGPLLRGKVGESFDVYRFGMSGAPLSQYLQMSRYVNRHFRPDVLIFVIIHNDFLHSLVQFSEHSHYLRLRYEDGVISPVEPQPFVPKPLRRLASHSALVRYLWLNVEVQSLIRGRRPAGHPDADAQQVKIRAERRETSREMVRVVTRFVIDAIRTENKDKRILFVMDAPREEIYAGNAPESNLQYNRMVGSVCEELQMPFLDLSDVFTDDYAARGVKFNSEYDYHWNEEGHRVVAEAIYDKLREMGVVVAGNQKE